MTTPTIIGLIGKKRAGKDSFAARLVSRHGFTRLGFADPLKAVLLELNPVVGPGEMPLSFLVRRCGWEGAKDSPEVRRLLQVLGTAMRDKVSKMVWLEAAMRKVATTPGPVVISDVRFLNEADAIKAAGGYLVRITREGTGGDRHVSETDLDGYPTEYTISNDGPLEALWAKADAIVADLNGLARTEREAA